MAILLMLGSFYFRGNLILPLVSAIMFFASALMVPYVEIPLPCYSNCTSSVVVYSYSNAYPVAYLFLGVGIVMLLHGIYMALHPMEEIGK